MTIFAHVLSCMRMRVSRGALVFAGTLRMVVMDEDARASNECRREERCLSIVALCENRKFEVGLACLQLSDFSIELCSLSDDAAYSRTLSVLTQHIPQQILIPPSSSDSVLARIVAAEFPHAAVSQVPRRNWNELRGLSYVRHYSHRSKAQALETDVKSKFLALSAFAALVDTMEQADGAKFVKGTLRVQYHSVEGVMLLDPATVANLELLRNLRTGDQKLSLFGALNQCKTAAGSRYLRSALLQPSTDVDTISARLDCVSELLEREEALIDANKVLMSFSDSDRLLKFFMTKQTSTGCARAKAAISAVLQLKAALSAAPQLADALTSSGEAPPSNELLRKVVENLSSSDLVRLADHIAEVIDDESTFRKRTSQRMLDCLYAIRSKLCTFIDVARETLDDSIMEMEQLRDAYAKQFDLSDLKLVWTERRGHHLMLPISQRETIERAGFIKIASQARKTVAFSTEQVMQLSARAQEMIQQILLSTESQVCMAHLESAAALVTSSPALTWLRASTRVNCLVLALQPISSPSLYSLATPTIVRALFPLCTAFKASWRSALVTSPRLSGGRVRRSRGRYARLRRLCTLLWRCVLSAQNCQCRAARAKALPPSPAREVGR